jgi:hypothetical protein
MLTLLICLLAQAVVPAQDNPPKAASVQSDAKKAFEKLKTLAGSWQGTIMGISINFTIRAASSGTAILHEGNTDGGGPPKHEITMFYLDKDRLLATHYCDAGNRAHFEGKMSPDGKRIELGFLDVVGSTRGGYLKGMAFTMIDANHHTVEATFVMPDGKPIQMRGEFQRTTSTPSVHSGNKRLYDGGAMMLILSAEKTPEEYYSFKPTDADPSFGQMLAVVANAQYQNCSAVLGEKNSRPKLEGTGTPKADLISALRDSFAYCGKAYDHLTDASAAQLVTFSGPMGPVPVPRQNLLNLNMGLNALHYGNLMVYMRLKNIVPPSADPDIQKQAGKTLKK